MKAIVQTGTRSVEVAERPRPSIDSNEVLVRVHSSGVCGSDAHAFLHDGGYEWVALPRIMGHEYSGEVVEVGSQVSSFAPGDRVVEEPTGRCGKCFQCNSGQSNVCQSFSVKGMHRDGSYAEYTVANPEYLHVVPDAVPLGHAAIAEPMSIATRAVLSQSALAPGDTALVEGPGPIGLLVATVANSIGVNVLLSGLEKDSEYRLPLARDLGIETVDLGETDLDAKTDAFTDGVGFDGVFDATGHHTGVEYAVKQVRKGGQVVILGLPGTSSAIEISPVVRGEVMINTSYGSNWQNFEQALSLIEEGVIDVEELVDTSFSITDPEAAFESFLASETCKPMFTFDEGT